MRELLAELAAHVRAAELRGKRVKRTRPPATVPREAADKTAYRIWKLAQGELTGVSSGSALDTGYRS